MVTRGLAGLTLWVLTGLSCGSNEHQLIVEVRTDLAPGIEFATVRAALSPGGEAPATIGATVGQDFASGARLAEWSSLEAGTYQLDVRAVDTAGGDVVARTVQIDLREDLAVVVVLSRSCRDVACPDGDDASQTTCVAGRCASPSCSEVDPAACPAPECTSDGECSTSAACAVAACVEGGCFEAPDDSACTAAEACVPEMGCVPRPGIDASVDAAMDGSADGGADADADAADADAGDAGVVTSMPTRVTTDGRSSQTPRIAWDGADTLGVVFAWDVAATGMLEVFFTTVDTRTGVPASSGPVRVSGPDVARSRLPVIAWVGDGWIVAWEDLADGTDRVNYTRLEPDGTKLGTDRVLTPTSRSFAPSIAFSGSEVAIAFADDRGTSRDVYVARMMPDGTTIGETHVTDATGSQGDPQILWNGTEWVIAYHDGRLSGPGRDIFLSRLDTSGSEIGDDVALTMDRNAAEVVLAARGSLLGLAYENDPETDGFYAEYDLATGSFTRAPGPLATTGTDLRVVAVADHFVALWSTTDPGTEQIWIQSFAAGGSAEQLTMTASTSEELDAVFTGSSIAIAWEDDVDTGGGAAQLYVQLIAPR